MFKAIGFAIRYLPLIIMAVQFVEGVTQPGVTGERKKKLAMDFLRAALAKFGIVMTPQVEDIVGMAIELVVTGLNKLGIFQSAHERIEEDAEEIVAEVAKKAVVVEDPNEAEFQRLTEALRR